MHRNNHDQEANPLQLANLTRAVRCLLLWTVLSLSVSLPAVSEARQLPQAAHATDNSPAAHFQLRADVEVGSLVVRVGDVIIPVGSRPENWQEIAGKAIALLPSDGRRLRLERQRISEQLDRSGLLNRTIRWSGPEFASIAFVSQEAAGDQGLSGQQPPSRSSSLTDRTEAAQRQPVIQTRFQPQPGVASDDITATRSIEKSKQVHPSLFPAERNRIERMILAAFPNTHAEVLQRFDVSIIPEDQGVNGLKDLRSIRNLRLAETPRSGRVELWVGGETETRNVEAVIAIEMTELPVVVYSTTPLSRGDILSARDLVAKPIALNQFDPRMVVDLQSLINKEVVRPISANRPMMEQDISEPVVIKRGDRVVIRVIGAGVVVTTEGRALAPAAAGESVMVETDQPKQKLVTRAVSTGVVEIVSRPPTFENR